MKLLHILAINFIYFILSCLSVVLLSGYVESFVLIPSFAIVSVAFVYLTLKYYSKRIVDFYSNERELLYSILDDVNAMIVVWSEDLSMYNANECFYTKTGFSEKYLNKKENFIKAFFACENFKSFSYKDYCIARQSKVLCNDSSCLTVLWKTTVIKSGKNQIFLSIGLDQTEFTNIQEQLSESERKFDLSIELSEIGLLFRYVDSNDIFISKNLQKMLGFSSQTISIDEFESKIHPNDLGIYRSYLENVKYSEMSHDIISMEFRLSCADDGYHWFTYRFKLSDSTYGGASFVGGCVIDISMDKEKDTLIEKMAYIDEVTQIFNRNRFMMLGQETYSCSKELGITYWLIILDVDKFHIINDTCGYHNGNRLLKDIAITIIKNLTDGGFCARIGGDNFAVLLKDTGNENYPVETIHNIQEALSHLNNDIFSSQTITVSAGYCKLPTDGDDFSEVLEHAEFALRMGELPRSNIIRYDNSIHDKILQKSTLEKELERAITNNELKLFYQPKINLSNNSLIGAEALIRWIKPDGTIVSPADFIPVAENSNLITRISEFVLKEACYQNKKWQNNGLGKIGVSVNLSSVDFYQTDVCKTIHDVIESAELDPEWLEIELTESLALKDVDHAIKQMNELKDIGVKISMDDFGTGYSSLSYIQVLPITLLKLDRSFVMNLESDEVSRQIVSAIISICKSKKIEIIAEGIETSGQAEFLRDTGCDHAQGYFFGRPMPADEFELYMKKAN